MGGMIRYLGLAHILAYGFPGMGGVGGIAHILAYGCADHK